MGESRFCQRSSQSPAFRAAVEAIRDLKEEGDEFQRRAYAEATAESRKEMWATARGLTQSQGRLCFNRLLGKQCRLSRGEECLMCRCPVSDHDTLWLKDGKPSLILCQPYPFGMGKLRELVEFCDLYGFNASINPWPSFHFPDGVVSVIIEPRKQTTSNV